MSRAICVALAVVFVLGLVGCGVKAPVVPPAGWVYNSQQSPLFPGKETGSKVGTSKSICILGLVGVGDASINAAANNGGITQIKHMDYDYFNVLGVYQRYTTIVRGE